MTIKFTVCRNNKDWIVSLQGGKSWRFDTLKEAMHAAYIVEANREAISDGPSYGCSTSGPDR
jgi:hypothetical protein